jgi:succinate dehydrogenase / fumarate reductase cytochrome b subunit
MTMAQVLFATGLVAVLVVSTGAATFVVASARNGDRYADHAELGRIAFLAHRISGLSIFAFLLLHILDVWLLSISHRLYDQIQRLYGSPPLRIFECALLFAVLFHTCNGLRLIALDVAPESRWPTRLLPLVLVIVVAGGTAGSVLILAPVIG